MKFSGKMLFMIILNVTKKEHSTLSLKNAFWEKPQGGVKLIHPAFVGSKQLNYEEVEGSDDKK